MQDEQTTTMAEGRQLKMISSIPTPYTYSHTRPSTNTEGGRSPCNNRERRADNHREAGRTMRGGPNNHRGEGGRTMTREGQGPQRLIIWLCLIQCRLGP